MVRSEKKRPRKRLFQHPGEPQKYIKAADQAFQPQEDHAKAADETFEPLEDVKAADEAFDSMEDIKTADES